jgi:phosphate transport system substrate-binding protein
MKSRGKYYLVAFIMTLVVTPAIISICLVAMILGLFDTVVDIPYILLIPPVLISILVWALYARFSKMPEGAFEIFLPLLGSNCYFLLVWVLFFGLSGYRFIYGAFGNLFGLFAAPYVVANGILSCIDQSELLPLIILATTLMIMATVIGVRKLSKKKTSYDKKLLYVGLAFLCLFCIASFQIHKHNEIVIDKDSGVEQVADEVDLYRYAPFAEGNALKRLGDKPNITFSGDYPRLDGATAAYPVYAAMAQELYLGLDERSVGEYVSCTTTDNAYERLLNGEIDIFFGAQPSRQQTQAAEERGLEFTLTPIGKEAFVFIVNSDNPVNSLTIEQIQAIYQKKITNWKDVGGNDETIMPFQRPENSGSQTIMLAAVMKDKAMTRPLWEENVGGMGGMLSQVAAYRNYSSAIGYSFRYYAVGMNPSSNIKLLAIDGVEPTVENIRTGAYPFTVDVYAVTVGPQSDSTRELLKWILSEQGQGILETCGYVRIDRKGALQLD